MAKELKSSSHRTVSANKKEAQKILKRLMGAAVNYSRILTFRGRGGVLKRNPLEKGGMSVVHEQMLTSLILKLNYSYWF